MKLVMTLLVRDEIDALAANIEFHLRQGVDFVVATDNGSVDGTRELLAAYEARGVVRLIDEPADDYAQGVWVTRMARLAATEHGADWVINNDADEFWWPELGDLKDALRSLPPGAEAASAERSNFVPRPDGDRQSFADRMTVRERESLNALGRKLPSKVCHRGFPSVEVGQGNHVCSVDGVTLAPIPAPITILHFPLRSYAQFENKIAKGGAAYGRNIHLPPDIGGTWRRLYEVWRAGDLPAHYAAETKSEDAMAAGLRDGSLIEDRRLRDFFRAHGIGAAKRAGAAA